MQGTVGPRSLDQILIVTDYIRWVKTSWTDSTSILRAQYWVGLTIHMHGLLTHPVCISTINTVVDEATRLKDISPTVFRTVKERMTMRVWGKIERKRERAG